MKKFINNIYQNQTTIYKITLLITVISTIVYFFPKVGKFKYEYQKGKPWQYDNLLAPFDFSIQKSKAELEKETAFIHGKIPLYFEKINIQIADIKKQGFDLLRSQLENEVVSESRIKTIEQLLSDVVDAVYNKGYIDSSVKSEVNINSVILIRDGQQIYKSNYGDFLNNQSLLRFVQQNIPDTISVHYKSMVIKILTELLRPNLYFDKLYTQKAIDEALDLMSYTKGKVSSKELIIARGDIVEGRKLAILNSLKDEYKSQIWSKTNYYWILGGYIILVSLVVGMLLLFLYVDRKEIFDNNTQLTFILFNVVLMVFLVTMTLKHQSSYLYAVPICTLPIVLKAFFDARVAMFSFLLMILMLGFIVPNSFEFIYLQTIAGFVTILTINNIHLRANLFISVFKITIVYMVTYLAFNIIHEGNINQINSDYFYEFGLNGLLLVISVFLIWFYEKIFGLVSDVTLLEISNTNNVLLKELNEKAPGTFQHSMQVANLAEAAAQKINANAMLVRAGALYHDIGKMDNPFYFTENQSTGVNPHSDLSPVESAKIIISHRQLGIEKAKMHGLPDRVIDFIRTHHGTSLVYYFYKMELDQNPDCINILDFTYPGPIPFSKETSILMMCDAAEAASKSLIRPTANQIESLVEKIVEKQKADGQFLNSNITLKEIEMVKKVIKKKLKNIYHVRIEYPE